MPCEDYHESSMERLKESVQALAAEPDVQLGIYPDFVAKVDELALDFDHWYSVCQPFLSVDAHNALILIDIQLETMSGPSGPWGEEDLRTDPRWEEVRSLAKRALSVLGWPLENPPPSSDVFVAFDK